MRSAGILLYVSSLPGDDGIGTLGEKAYNFIDFLAESKQQYWQTPPLNHLKENGSPYNCYSVFSGNIYLIDVKKLVINGLLDEKSYKQYIKLFKYDNYRINYKQLYLKKIHILRKSFKQSYNKIKDKVTNFRNKNTFWLEDYALYMCLKKYVFDNKPWQQWDESIKNRKKITIDIYKEQLKDNIDFFIFLQYLFYWQWFALKRYANSKNVKLIGELPLYCDVDSCDVWSKPNLFMLNEYKYQSQHLYHDDNLIYKKYDFKNKAIYNIDNLKKSHYKFMIQRTQFLYNVYDELVIDNFDQYNKYKYTQANDLGLKSQVYYEKEGFKGDIFDVLKNIILFFNPILNDINFCDNELETYDFPVAKIMSIGHKFSTCLPHNYKPTDVIYTSDYVFSPLTKWRSLLPGLQKLQWYKYINGKSRRNFDYDFIAMAYQSAAEKIITPIQDVLNISKNSYLYKLNKKNNSWSWRILERRLNKNISNKLKNFSLLYERY